MAAPQPAGAKRSPKKAAAPKKTALESKYQDRLEEVEERGLEDD